MTNITDENFEKELQKTDKLVLVDFFATWCGPCAVFGPVIEKVAEKFKNKICFLKVDLDNIPVTAQRLSIDRIPTTVVFKNNKMVDSFVGVWAEGDIIKWLEKIISNSPMENSIQQQIDKLAEWSANYAKENGFNLNPDRAVVERLMRGLLENEKKNGQKTCPCRRFTGNKEIDEKSVCPCFYHKDEIAEDGHCLCNLFVK
ncbi:MAG: thioredoxin [Candidatus Falkowbacteria bacterium]|nr:thioredoxin [Candidatus Falkowbacteria bacterium]